MYTLVRFSASDTCTDETLIQFGARLNELVPRAFDRLDRAGRRFSVSVSKKDHWEASIADMLAFIQSARSSIDEARGIGIDISADALIEPEDFRGYSRLSCEINADLQARLLEANMTLHLTIVSTEHVTTSADR